MELLVEYVTQRAEHLSLVRCDSVWRSTEVWNADDHDICTSILDNRVPDVANQLGRGLHHRVTSVRSCCLIHLKPLCAGDDAIFVQGQYVSFRRRPICHLCDDVIHSGPNNNQICGLKRAIRASEVRVYLLNHRHTRFRSAAGPEGQAGFTPTRHTCAPSGICSTTNSAWARRLYVIVDMEGRCYVQTELGRQILHPYSGGALVVISGEHAAVVWRTSVVSDRSVWCVGSDIAQAVPKRYDRSQYDRNAGMRVICPLECKRARRRWWGLRT